MYVCVVLNRVYTGNALLLSIRAFLSRCFFFARENNDLIIAERIFLYMYTFEVRALYRFFNVSRVPIYYISNKIERERESVFRIYKFAKHETLSLSLSSVASRMYMYIRIIFGAQVKRVFWT